MAWAITCTYSVFEGAFGKHGRHGLPFTCWLPVPKQVFNFANQNILTIRGVPGCGTLVLYTQMNLRTNSARYCGGGAS